MRLTLKPTQAGSPFSGWRMVFIAFLSYNCATGLISGFSGTLLPILQKDFGASRGSTSMMFGMEYLAVGLFAPIAGNLLRKHSLRKLMTVSSLMGAIGFVALAFVNSLNLVILIYGAVLGATVSILGVLFPPTLINRWFVHGAGKALGLGTMPLFMLIAPPMAAALVELGGRRLAFLTLAGIFALLAVIARLVVNSPEDVGQKALWNYVDEVATAGERSTASRELSACEFFGDSRFWCLALAIGLLNCTGIIFVSQGTSLAMSRGLDLTAASTLVSGYGAGALVGSSMFGWLIDKAGPLRALVVCLAAEAALWFALSEVSSLPALITVSAFIGVGHGAILALHSAVMNRMYGERNFSRAMGYGYTLKIPFLFGAAPLAGYLFDITGSYWSTLLFCSGAVAVATIFAALLVVDRRNRIAENASVPINVLQ